MQRVGRWVPLFCEGGGHTALSSYYIYIYMEKDYIMQNALFIARWIYHDALGHLFDLIACVCVCVY